MVSDELLKKIAYVKCSKNRVKIIKSLEDTIKIPTKICDDTGIKINHVSIILRELKEAGIVECINEEAVRGRIYRLTSTGEEIVKNLDII